MTSVPDQPVFERIAPQGVGSGISVRKLPTPSIQHIVDTCDFYLAKSSGCSSNTAKTSRFLSQCCKEIKHVAKECEQVYLFRHEKIKKELEHYRQICDQWEKVFREPMQGVSSIFPQDLKSEIQKLRKHNDYLQQELDRKEQVYKRSEDELKQNTNKKEQEIREDLLKLKQRYEKDLSDLQQEMKEKHEKNNKLETEIWETKGELAKCRSTNESVKKRSDALVKQISNLINENNRFRNELNQLRNTETNSNASIETDLNTSSNYPSECCYGYNIDSCDHNSFENHDSKMNEIYAPYSPCKNCKPLKHCWSKKGKSRSDKQRNKIIRQYHYDPQLGQRLAAICTQSHQ